MDIHPTAPPPHHTKPTVQRLNVNGINSAPHPIAHRPTTPPDQTVQRLNINGVNSSSSTVTCSNLMTRLLR